MSNDLSVCAECEGSFGCLSSPAACPKCEKLLCSTCASKYPLIVFDPNNPEESNDLSKNKEIQSFCKDCFHETSVLDFSKTSDVVEQPKTSNGITLVFGHAAGSSRAMFMPHARMLAEKQGYKCILLDFPGHGSLVDEPLSLKTCAETIKKILTKYNLKPGGKTIYVGASLGAYVGFYVLKEHQEYFKGAILLDCGQNVGPGASLKARMGLWFLKAITNNLSNKAMMGVMVSAMEKSPADYKLVESTFGAGFFFRQGPQQVECLKGVAPAEIIPELDIPILFFNGSEDYSDSQDKWLESCKDKRSELKVYEKGDHFFCNDSSFVNDMLDRFDTFSKAVVV
jgi:pimeloyl-ACP methyl ester carboxylesterase